MKKSGSIVACAVLTLVGTVCAEELPYAASSFDGAGVRHFTYDAKPHVGTDVLKTVVKNLREHVLSLGGSGCLCLGGDLDGIRAMPCGWRGVEDMEALYNSLLRRSYSEALLEKIFYGNLMSYVERVL